MGGAGWKKCSWRLGGPGRLDEEGCERSVKSQEVAPQAEIGRTESRQREE